MPTKPRRGVTLPSLFFGGKPAGTSADPPAATQAQAPAMAPAAASDRPLDDSYRELMRDKMASLDKAPIPEIPATEIDNLESLFAGADANADGVVDFTEFKGVMEKLAETTGKRYNTLQLRGLFRMADLDGSGYIDFNEFIHAQRRMRKNWGTAKAATMMMMAMNSSKK